MGDEGVIPVLDRASGMLYLQHGSRRQALFRIDSSGTLHFMWHRGFKAEVPVSMAEIGAYVNIVRGRPGE